MSVATKVLDLPNINISIEKSQIRGFSFLMGFLLPLLLLTALSLVYIKDLNRRLFIDYQTLQQQSNQMLLDWGKLLLEKSTWSVQARVEQLAENSLQMRIPQSGDIVLLPLQATTTRTFVLADAQ